MLIFHCKKEKAALMSVSHSGTWIQVTFCDLLKNFQCPTGARESLFSKLALSSSLSLLFCRKVCRAVCLCLAKQGIHGILSPRANLSAGGGKLNVPAVMGHCSCPAVAPGVMWPWAMFQLVLHTPAKANQKRIIALKAWWDISKGVKQFLCLSRPCKLFSRSDMVKICSVRKVF